MLRTFIASVRLFRRADARRTVSGPRLVGWLLGVAGAVAVGSWAGQSIALEPTTALAVTPFHEARLVRGDDGNDHVEYDLLVINAFLAPVKLKSIAVINARGAELMRLEGGALVEATQSIL